MRLIPIIEHKHHARKRTAHSALLWIALLLVTPELAADMPGAGLRQDALLEAQRKAQQAEADKQRLLQQQAESQRLAEQTAKENAALRQKAEAAEVEKQRLEKEKVQEQQKAEQALAEQRRLQTELEQAAKKEKPLYTPLGASGKASTASPHPNPSPDGEGLKPTPSLYATGSIIKDCETCPELVVIPPGSFMMGSSANETGRYSDEGPQHAVTISQSFALGRYEVTFDEYDRFAQATQRKLPGDFGWGRGKRPVIRVSWDDANAYAAWLSQQTGQTYRLPTEAEWEYAARAGISSAYWWGEQASHEQANYGKDECCGGLAQGRDQWEHTAPVGGFPANAFGLYDTSGNVREWTADCWHDDYQNAPVDGGAWLETNQGSCGLRVVRGGSWNNNPLVLRSAFRFRDSTDVAIYYLGFRLARAL